MKSSVVIMGVSGCGKSSLAAAVASREAMPLIEGDEHHSPESREKMRQGIALTDADRQGWLDTLASILASRRPGGQGAGPAAPCVLACSALRRSYRDLLRRGDPDVRFVFMDISRDEAALRVRSRPGHFFSASLVDSQFATLESPVGEPGVLRVDATASLDLLGDEVSAWLRGAPRTPG